MRATNTFRLRFSYESSTWPRQIELACSLLETVFPNNPIDGAIVPKGAMYIHRKVEDRLNYLRQRGKTRLRRFTLNNHFSCVAASGKIGPTYVGHMGLGGSILTEQTYLLFVTLPPGQSSQTYAQVTAAIGQLFNAEPEDASIQLSERRPPIFHAA